MINADPTPISYLEGMDRVQTVVCVKRVKQEVAEEWDESMPLPGDIIEGFAEDDGDDDDDGYDHLFKPPAIVKRQFCSNLRKIRKCIKTDKIWLKVRRGGEICKLRVRVVSRRNALLLNKYTFMAARDDRHVAVLRDLTLDECLQLQEMSRKMVRVEFSRTSVNYEWKMKIGRFLPDQGTTVVSSLLFMPLEHESCTKATLARSMAWFSSAISSGVPLVFVNIQTEQIVNANAITCIATETTCCFKPQRLSAVVEVVQGIRLWFLPGVAEVLAEMAPEPGETRFGMDIRMTDEGFIYVESVMEGSAADRAGVRKTVEEGSERGQIVVMSRLGGKSVMPSTAGSEGLINCCNLHELRQTLLSAIDSGERVQAHFMAWPNSRPITTTQPFAVATLRPPRFSSDYDGSL